MMLGRVFLMCPSLSVFFFYRLQWYREFDNFSVKSPSSMNWQHCQYPIKYKQVQTFTKRERCSFLPRSLREQLRESFHSFNIWGSSCPRMNHGRNSQTNAPEINPWDSTSDNKYCLQRVKYILSSDSMNLYLAGLSRPRVKISQGETRN